MTLRGAAQRDRCLYITRATARHGHPREPSTTPHELAGRLSAQQPANARALSELTDFYTKERYAERPCTDAEQERARKLLHELTR